MLMAAERGDQQRDQAEPVGDHVAGALAQPVPDQHADARCRAARWPCSRRCRSPGTWHASSLSCRVPGRIPGYPMSVVLGVISHLGPVREVSGRPTSRTDRGQSCGRRSVAGRRLEEVSPCSAARCSIRDAAPDDAAALVEVWGGVARPARPSVDAAARRRAGGRPPRSPGSPPTPTSGCSWPRIDDQVVGAVHLMRGAALAGARRHRGLRHAPAGHRGLPPARRRPRADGGRGAAGPRRRTPSTSSPRPRSASRDANRFMARLGLAPDRRGPRRDRRRRCAPSCPWSRRPPPGWARRSHRNVGQVLAQRRSHARARRPAPS